MLYIHTFGRPSVVKDGRTLTGAGAQPRRLALLTRLACAGDRGLTRDKLLALFWPDADEERARRGLTQAVYALRHDLGAEDALLGTWDLRLNPALMSSDVAEFSAAVTARAWDRAVGRYTAPFLDGFHLPSAPEFERWAEEQRGALAREHSLALDRLAQAATDAGDRVAAVGWLRKLAAQDPLNAEVAVRLMTALLAAGDRNGALKHAQIYEALLEQELDVPMDREVLAFAEQIRREWSEPVVAPAVEAAPPAQGEGSDKPAPAEVAAREPPGAIEERAPPTSARRPAALATPRRSGVRRHHVAITATLVLLGAALSLGLFVRRNADVLLPGPTRRVAVDAALELDPALSPDGAMLAYAADPEGHMRLFVRRMTGGRAVPISEGLPGHHRSPRWSPDGSHVAFQAGGQIYQVPALGGSPRLLVAASPGKWAAYPAWSPDGQEIAYVEDWVIYARRTGGGSPRPITQHRLAHSLAWSPDGKWIAFVAGNPTFVFGESPVGSPANIGNVAPSSIWVVPAAGGEAVRVTEDRSLHMSPAWLPGGPRLLYVSDRDGSRDVYVVRLGSSGAPAGGPRRLTTGLGAHTISVSPDGSRLAYSVYTQSANIWSIAVPQAGAVAAAAATPVTTGSQAIEGLAVSPDGRWLAFDSDRSGNQDIYRIPLGDRSAPIDAGELVQLTTDPADDFVSSWSPDGRELAYHSYRNGARHVRVLPAEGGAGVEVVDFPPNQRSPGWGAGGTSLVFTSDVTGSLELYVVSRHDGLSWGSARRLTPHGGWAGRWAPDAHAIVYCRADGLWLITPDGGAPAQLVRVGGPDEPVPELALWSPDGRAIYYKAFDARGRSSIWAIPAAGGTPRLLVQFDDPYRQSHRPEFATDGGRLYFTLSARDSDIWTMEFLSRR